MIIDNDFLYVGNARLHAVLTAMEFLAELF